MGERTGKTPPRLGLLGVGRCRSQASAGVGGMRMSSRYIWVVCRLRHLRVVGLLHVLRIRGRDGQSLGQAFAEEAEHRRSLYAQ